MPKSYVKRAGERTPQKHGPNQIGRTIRFPKPQFYDPFFSIQGSVPEKMVMAELVRRGIYFEHTPQTNPIEWGMYKQIATSDPTNWEADFLFPQYKIWLEVQGAYFHTLPGVREKEAMRFVIIEAAGWQPIYWWDYDIEARLVEMMDDVPEFYFTAEGSVSGPVSLPQSAPGTVLSTAVGVVLVSYEGDFEEDVISLAGGEEVVHLGKLPGEVDIHHPSPDRDDLPVFRRVSCHCEPPPETARVMNSPGQGNCVREPVPPQVR